jgi:predicted MPP superfamily phosphohydrolase
MLRLSRRQLVLGGVAGGFGVLAGAGLAGYEAYAVEPFSPQLERISVPVPAGHDDLAGLTIGFLADIHHGPAISEDDVARALRLIGAEQPALILLGGDYVSASPRFAAPVAALLGELVRQAPLGGYAVLGNHDCGERGREAIVTDALEQAGIPVLRNAAAKIATGQGELWIAGVDEAIMAHADPAAAFTAIPAGAAALALWHEPDYAEQTARRGAFVQLSGHSHGGQVRLPEIGPLFLPKGGERFVMGFNQVAGMPIYTSRGVGVFLPPLRVNCPPEVTLITLVAA